MANDVIKIEAGEKTVKLQISPTRLILNGFISGFFWGVGSALGATFIIGLLLLVLGQLDTAPVIGRYISNILNYIQATR